MFILHLSILFKVKDFPFDTQCCEVNFYSWAHTTSQMVIRQNGNKNFTNLTHLASSTEWFIYDTCASNFTITTNENLHWWVNKYVVHIKRESIYHVYTLLMPCCSKFRELKQFKIISTIRIYGSILEK